MRRIPDGHPLSTSPGARVAVARINLFDKIGPGKHACHWCGESVSWSPGLGPSFGALIADHLNWDRNDDSPDNLVPACTVCNAHRTHKGNRKVIKEGELQVAIGSKTRTRAIERFCVHCGTKFLAVPAQVRQGRGLYCSRSCARKHGWVLRRAGHG